MEATSIFLAISLSIMMSANGQDLSKYLGKTVHETIKLAEFNNYESSAFIDQQPGILSGIAFFYKDGSYIIFNFRKFNYATSYRANRKWVFSNVIKEKISYIEKYNSDGNLVDEAH